LKQDKALHRKKEAVGLISLYLGRFPQRSTATARLYRHVARASRFHLIESRPYSFHAVEGFLEKV
jgi:hypothetical protein